MANFGTTQMVLALFLFACGAVPAIAALIGEKRSGGLRSELMLSCSTTRPAGELSRSAADRPPRCRRCRKHRDSLVAQPTGNRSNQHHDGHGTRRWPVHTAESISRIWYDGQPEGPQSIAYRLRAQPSCSCRLSCPRHRPNPAISSRRAVADGYQAPPPAVPAAAQTRSWQPPPWLPPQESEFRRSRKPASRSPSPFCPDMLRPGLTPDAAQH